jgi:hypothetical protein
MRHRDLFANGSLVPISMGKGVVAYARENEKEALYVAINRSAEPYTLKISGAWQNILTKKHGQGDVTVAPDEGVWLYVDRR